MKFSYKYYTPGILRPVLPIKVVNGGTVVGYEVLVDSGADVNIFDREIGELIGLDIEGG